MMTKTSSSMWCRLCLNRDELIHVYDGRLANGHQLRMCILLCTGVQINEEDRVSKMVCHKCCSLAVKLYHYRQTVLANDKALKEIADQPFEQPPFNKDAILELHQSILDNVSRCKITDTVTQVYDASLDDNEQKVIEEGANDNGDSNSKKLFQYFPGGAAVPREAFHSKDSAAVPRDGSNSKEYEDSSEYEVFPADNSDGRVLKFKRKYPSAEVVSVKRRRRESYRDDFSFSDSDSSAQPVFKSRKKIARLHSDASYSDDCQSDDEKSAAETEDGGESRTRELRRNISKNPLQFPESDSDNESPKKPTNTKYCAICDRTFWGWSQLKSHQRTHLRCVVCRITCDSQEDLEYHVKNVCYKNIEENQPILLLPKVDDNPFLLHIYRDAFERYFQDIEDGVYGSTEPPPPPDPDYPLYHDEERVRVETDFIQSIFDRYKHLDDTPVVRNKITQTRRAETNIQYYSRNHIVVEDMHRDLTMYKVPVNVVVSPRVSAHLSFATGLKGCDDPVEKWSLETILDIVVPQKDPTYFLRPKKPPPQPQPKSKLMGPKSAMAAKAAKAEKNSKLLKALTATTTTTTPAPTIAPGKTVQAKTYSISKLLATTTCAPTKSKPAVPKTTKVINRVPTVPSRISSEVSLVPKSNPVSKPANTTPVYTNVGLRFPISTPAPPVRRPAPPPIRPPQSPQQPYVKQESDLAQQAPFENVAPSTPSNVQPPPSQNTYVQAPCYQPPVSYGALSMPPTQNLNQSEVYLKQEHQEIEDAMQSASSYQPPPLHYNFQNQGYRMSAPRNVYNNHQMAYAAPNQQVRYRSVSKQQFYNANHSQNGLRYRGVSGGGMMVHTQHSQPNNQNVTLLNHLQPLPSLNSMGATHLLQSMNHMTNNLNHHHLPQQNHGNHIPSPLRSAPSPIETKPLMSPYSSASTLYEHSYADTYANSSYPESFNSPSYGMQGQQLQQQYHSSYSPLSHAAEVDPYADQMMQQAAPSTSNGSKAVLRVKQPWELNQS